MPAEVLQLVDDVLLRSISSLPGPHINGPIVLPLEKPVVALGAPGTADEQDIVAGVVVEKVGEDDLFQHSSVFICEIGVHAERAFGLGEDKLRNPPELAPNRVAGTRSPVLIP